VNGATVVPVKDGDANLIPLPQRADPNAVQTLDFKLASRSANPKHITTAAPILGAPVLLAEWKVEPDTAQRLTYKGGSLRPATGVADVSGFAALANMFSGRGSGEPSLVLLAAMALVIFALCAWRWASRPGSYRFAVRHLGGVVIGVAAIVLSALLFMMLREMAARQDQFLSRGLTFVAPVQQGNSALTVEVSNLADEFSFWRAVGQAWPAGLALAVWAFAWLGARNQFRTILVLLGWTLLAWASLRWPNGASWFFILLMAFLLLHVILPALRAALQVPPKPATPPTGETPAPAAAALLIGSLLVWSCNVEAAQPTKDPALADSVTQQIRIEDQFAFATAKVHWQAQKDQLLPILFQPAVLTRINYPTNALKLVQVFSAPKPSQQLLAQQDGSFDIEFQYQVHISKKDGGSGFVLPTQHGLVNRLTLTIPDIEADVAAPNAVSVQYDTGSTNSTVASLILAPVTDAWIGWNPRSRDVKREKPVFFAELSQLYAPAAGVIEGVHQVQIRPAQGELSELIFEVPAGATITDVLEAGRGQRSSADRSLSSTNTGIISLWRFDPDSRNLRVSLNPPQSKPFAILIRSQVATGTLPVEQSLGLLSVKNAAGQLGSLGIATGSEVQLDNVTNENFSAINLEDFPPSTLEPLQARLAGSPSAAPSVTPIRKPPSP